MNKETQKKDREIGPLDFDGAAIINADGSETPITEEMIRTACEDIASAAPENKDTDKTHH